MKRFIDLSHTIEDGMVTYKGLPGPIICDYLSREQSRSIYAPGYEFQIGKIEMVSNTGTYVDVPFHRFADGKDLSETHIEKFAELPGIVVRANYRDGITVDKNRFEGLSLKGKAVLIHTDWCEHWRTEKYFHKHPFLT
ncbi:MAG: cyclase family protein, partial [Bacteroidota bacterium]